MCGNAPLRTLLSVLFFSVPTALADERPRALVEGEKVAVAFDVSVSWKERAASPFVGWGPFDLDVGQEMSALVPFALGVAGGPDGCGGEAGTVLPADLLGRQRYVWTADAKLLAAATDRLVLSASWKRLARDPRGAVVEVAKETIPRLVLREGERVVLDFLSTPDGCARNYSLELTAAVHESSAFADRQVAYDLWFVHEADGRSRSDRTRMTAKQGEEIAFAFPKVAIPSPAGTLDVLVRGQLRGRVRTDGTIDLALATHKEVSRGGGVSGATGEKWLSVKPADAVRVELPESPDTRGHAFALIVTAKAL